MNRKSMIQEYYMLVTNKHGEMGNLRREDSKVGLVVAGLYELLEAKVILIDKKVIKVLKDLPDELSYLSSLYSYLNKKPRTISNVINNYLAYSVQRINLLIKDICKPLLKEGLVVEAKGGFSGRKTVYIPDAGYKEKLMTQIKLNVSNGNEIESNDLALIYILKKTKNIKQYYSSEELNSLKIMFDSVKNKTLIDYASYHDMVTICFLLFVIITIIYL